MTEQTPASASEHFSSDAYPITIGAKFWSNDLKVIHITEVAVHANAYSGTGETQTWHQTNDGQFDTLSGALGEFGRLTRFYPHERFSGDPVAVSAELHPVGTDYNDVKRG